MPRPKWTAVLSVARQKWSVAFPPRAVLEQIRADKLQEAKFIISGPAAICTIHYPLEARHAEPSWSFVDAAATTVKSLPGKLSVGYTDQCVRDGHLGRRESDQEEILLCIRAVAKRPAGVATVQLVRPGAEHSGVDVPVVGQTSQRTKKRPRGRVHRISTVRSEDKRTVGRIALARMCCTEIDVPGIGYEVQLWRPNIDGPRRTHLWPPNNGFLTVAKVFHGRGRPYFDAVAQGESEVKPTMSCYHPRVGCVRVTNHYVGHGLKQTLVNRWLRKSWMDGVRLSTESNANLFLAIDPG